MARMTPPVPPSPPSPPLPSPFGPLDFQLVLLRRMADHQPALVEDARRELGVSAARMREANSRWQSMLRSRTSRGALARYRSVLGEPETSARRSLADLEWEEHRWPVPLWPDLRFEATTTVGGGTLWNEWLVRAPGAASPVLRTAGDLTPWSCTVDEASRAFAPAAPMEGSAPTRQQLYLTLPGGERRIAEFAWGLYQRLL
ncbi:hypothetical protein [Streptomyces tsukubensis]|uniref:hypothetical protein n=1 Tax=Streptomyces tsukubensis TaxID=83656 RepID=UPI003F4EBD6B